MPTWGFAALVLIAILVVYFPAIRGQPIWDDDGHITRQELKSLHGLWRIWSEPGATQQYYPLLHTAFWIENKLWGDLPIGYHLVNIALHVYAVVVVKMILQRLSLPGSGLAAAIFALHPVHVESVAWISEQKNTLSAAFYLTACLVYLDYDQSRRKKQYLLALTLFVLGLLSKTATAMLPAVLLVIFWWLRGRLRWKHDVLPLLPWLILGASAGLFSAWVERRFIGAEGEGFELDFFSRIVLAGRAVLFYLGKLLWPVNLVFIYPRWEINARAWWQWLFPAAVVAMTAAAWMLRRKWRGPLAAILLFVGLLFPVLGFVNIYPFVYSFVADHFQYLPSLAIIALASACLAMLPAPAWARWTGTALVLCTLGTLTWRQTHIYKDPIKLYQAILERNPDCWMAHNNLAILLAGKNQPQRAMEHYQQAIKLKPDYIEALTNLGSLLTQLGQTEQAIAYHKRALEIRPDYAQAHSNLGSVLASAGKIQQAIVCYELAIKLKPSMYDGYNNLGNALASLGRYEEAAGRFRQAIDLQPDRPEAYNNLAIVLAHTGQYEQALAYVQQALRLNPDYAEAYCNLGSLHASAGHLQEAIAEFQQALRLKPEYAQARYNLAGVLLQLGQLHDAIAQLKQAISLQPDMIEAHVSLAMAYDRIGQTEQAIESARRALELARIRGNLQIERQLELWLAHRASTKPSLSTTRFLQ